MKKMMFNDKFGLTDAVLRGKKTQTRRIEFDKRMQQELAEADAIGYGQGCCQVWRDGKIARQIPSRYKVGEVVAVAQSYKDAGFRKGYYRDEDTLIPLFVGKNTKKDIPVAISGWANKMFVRADLMPHCVLITDVRVERLQDISDEDCIKEGLEWDAEAGRFYTKYRQQTPAHILLGTTPRDAYAALIDKIFGKGTWESNPFVFVYDFELV